MRLTLAKWSDFLSAYPKLTNDVDGGSVGEEQAFVSCFPCSLSSLTHQCSVVPGLLYLLSMSLCNKDRLYMIAKSPAACLEQWYRWYLSCFRLLRIRKHRLREHWSRRSGNAKVPGLKVTTCLDSLDTCSYLRPTRAHVYWAQLRVSMIIAYLKDDRSNLFVQLSTHIKIRRHNWVHNSR